MTVMVSPAETLYCLPPVLMTANILLFPCSFRLWRVPPAGFFAVDRCAPARRANAAKEKRGVAAALEQKNA
jgi:hypothetical protein